jgi:serine/threonine-protein kinase
VPPSERLGRTVPADLERLILACLAKSPDDRPRDATAFQEALLACESAGSFSRERAALWWRDQYPLVERRRQRAEHPPEARFLHVTRHVAG